MTNQDNSIGGPCTTMNKHGCQHVVLNRTRSILLHVFLLALCSVLLQVRVFTYYPRSSRINQLIDWRSRQLVSDFLLSIHYLLRQDLQRQDGKEGIGSGQAHVSARYKGNRYYEQSSDSSIETFAQFWQSLANAAHRKGQKCVSLKDIASL